MILALGTISNHTACPVIFYLWLSLPRDVHVESNATCALNRQKGSNTNATQCLVLAEDGQPFPKTRLRFRQQVPEVEIQAR